MERKLIVTQIKSAIGRKKSHRQCLRGLGVKRIRKSVVVASTAENIGMINVIRYMLSVEEVG